MGAQQARVRARRSAMRRCWSSARARARRRTRAGQPFVGKAGTAAGPDAGGGRADGPGLHHQHRVLAPAGQPHADAAGTGGLRALRGAGLRPDEAEGGAAAGRGRGQVACCRPTRASCGCAASGANGGWPRATSRRPAMPTLHPAFLLRQPQAKRQAWADMLALAARLDGPRQRLRRNSYRCSMPLYVIEGFTALRHSSCLTTDRRQRVPILNRDGSALHEGAAAYVQFPPRVLRRRRSPSCWPAFPPPPLPALAAPEPYLSVVASEADETGEQGIRIGTNALSTADRMSYTTAFDALRRGDLDAARASARQANDRVLLGQVEFERLFHADYTATYDELAAWLEDYADLPCAQRVYALAMRRRPDGAAEPTRPTGVSSAAPGTSVAAAGGNYRGRSGQGRPRRPEPRRPERRRRPGRTDRRLVDRGPGRLAAGRLRRGLRRPSSASPSIRPRTAGSAPGAGVWAARAAGQIGRQDRVHRVPDTWPPAGPPPSTARSPCVSWARSRRSRTWRPDAL